MKNNNIRPNGLKGNESISRMKALMGIQPMNENTINRAVVELTKVGPDGKIYGIVRENHDYYIKTTEKTTNLVAEDFQYIGGLVNKKDKVYPTYAKALKQLNLSFISIAEAAGSTNHVNAFLNDRLIKENDEDEYVDYTMGRDDDDQLPNPAKELHIEGEEPIEETESTSGIVRGAGHDTHIMENEEDELSENDKAIDEMISGNEADVPVVENYIQNNRLKIGKAVQLVNEGETRNEQVKSLIGNLSDRERAALIEELKKKV